MVEDRHKGFHERRHLLPQLPRDGPAKGYQDSPGISIRYRQYAVHRTSWTAHPGAIRREYRARLSPVVFFFCEKSGRSERSCVAQRNETKRSLAQDMFSMEIDIVPLCSRVRVTK